MAQRLGDLYEKAARGELEIEAAKQAIANGFDKEIDESYLSFLYMPFMHSESKEVHEIAVELFNKPGMEGCYTSSSRKLLRVYCKIR